MDPVQIQIDRRGSDENYFRVDQHADPTRSIMSEPDRTDISVRGNFIISLPTRQLRAMAESNGASSLEEEVARLAKEHFGGFVDDLVQQHTGKRPDYNREQHAGGYGQNQRNLAGHAARPYRSYDEFHMVDEPMYKRIVDDVHSWETPAPPPESERAPLDQLDHDVERVAALAR